CPPAHPRGPAMTRTFRPCRLLVLFALLSGSAAWADNWPAWRGPGGQGHCTETNLPLKWSAKDNGRWKVKLSEGGNSTPISREDRTFLTKANKGGTVRGLLCLGRKDGKLLWQKDIEYPQKEQAWNQSYYASASPVTDGQRVVVSFGSAGMCCYDLSGKE